MVMAAKKNEKDEYRPVRLVNRSARFEYEITETFEAGIVLTGTEIKSVRQSQANLQDSFCRVNGNEVWVYNLHIAPYEQGNRYNVEARRPRKLLLHRWQINKLLIGAQDKGLTIIPTVLYFKQGYAKVEIGIARGKKLYDKRDSIAGRDRDREAQRELASREH
jgi:SsrA-binding protein